MTTYDAIVVGGGPGGSSAATFIARAGHRVLLLEKTTFPRHQIGESLLPATIQGICPLLGVKEEVDAASFIPKAGGTFIWGKSKIPWTFLFEKKAPNQPPRATAYQVERHKFDEILLNNAIKSGVTVQTQCQVLDVIKEGERVVGIEYKNPEGDIISVRSRFVVDASGHRSPIAHHVGERVESKFFRNIALYTYFENASRLPSPNENNILSAAFKHGWIWYIPLSKNLTSVGVVIDKAFFEREKKPVEVMYDACLEACPKVRDFLANAKRLTDEKYAPLRVRKDFSYTTNRFWVPGMALIGDAACFVDPLFSSGVHLATYAALLVARSINTSLKNQTPEDRCFDEFERRYRKEYGNFYNFLLAFYDMSREEEDYYWQARQVLHTEEAGNEAFIRLISGYSNDFFTQKIGLGDALKDFLTDEKSHKSVSKNQGIDPEGFMKGFTHEVSVLQAQALGINLEKMLGVSAELIASDDALHWCEA